MPLLLRVAVLAVALAAGASPAYAAPAEPGSATPSTAASACAGPCPTFLYFKGNAAGRVTSSPPGFSCDASCELLLPDETVVGQPTMVLHATPTTPGSKFLAWEGNCPKTVPPAGCEVALNAANAQYRLCVTFVVEGTAPPPTDCPPQYVPPPSPPPPAGPPRLGSKCTIRGSAGPDRISGTAVRDVICGRGGNDVINARGNHDLILGGGGNDRITGGAGRDHLRGEAGRDTFYARDRTRDTVNGGRGGDRARVDRSDRRVSIERRF